MDDSRRRAAEELRRLALFAKEELERVEQQSPVAHAVFNVVRAKRASKLNGPDDLVEVVLGSLLDFEAVVEEAPPPKKDKEKTP